MQVEIKATVKLDNIIITNLDKNLCKFTPFDNEWYKFLIPCKRNNITDITIDGETIKQVLNAGRETDKGYELWLHGDMSVLFSRVKMCIAQRDLLKFQDLSTRYLHTVSWNEKVEGDYISSTDKKFFQSGAGPHWWSKYDFRNIPYIEIQKDIQVNKTLLLEDINKELLWKDNKFYGTTNCKSLQVRPNLPCIDINDIKGNELKKLMTNAGFSKILQMTYVEMKPKSSIPLHRDDFLYESGHHIIEGPTQFYFLLSGNPNEVHLRFGRAGMIDVSKPIFINNSEFMHSLVYTGNTVRGAFLAYGISELTNKSFIENFKN